MTLCCLFWYSGLSSSKERFISINCCWKHLALTVFPGFNSSMFATYWTQQHNTIHTLFNLSLVRVWHLLVKQQNGVVSNFYSTNCSSAPSVVWNPHFILVHPVITLYILLTKSMCKQCLKITTLMTELRIVAIFHVTEVMTHIIWRILNRNSNYISMTDRCLSLFAFSL